MTESVQRLLQEKDVPSLHDCHVHGVHWHREDFTFSLDLHYIVRWIEPKDDEPFYTFMVAEATLTFEGATGVVLTMDWSAGGLDAQIDSLEILEERRSPNGRLERRFVIEFTEPDARISLWSVGYSVRLHSEPMASRTAWPSGGQQRGRPDQGEDPTGLTSTDEQEV